MPAHLIGKGRPYYLGFPVRSSCDSSPSGGFPPPVPSSVQGRFFVNIRKQRAFCFSVLVPLQCDTLRYALGIRMPGVPV